jgi:protein O-mannosyl-transferase
MSSSRSRTAKLITQRRSKALWFPLAAVAAATAVTYGPTLQNGFVNFDDDRLLLHNPYLRLDWLSTLRWMWSTTFLGHYQPLTWLSLWMDYALAGLSPRAYHVDSLAWHTAAALLVYAVFVRLLSRTKAADLAGDRRLPACAAVGALFWAVHPLRVESVAWVAERRDPVSLVFLLAALLAHLHAVDGRAGSRRWRIASYACLALSLLAKAWGMTFVVTLIALDVFPLGRLPLAREAFAEPRYRPVWREKVPYALVGLAGAVGAWVAQRGQPDTMLTVSQWTWTDRALQAGYGLCFYVWKTIWPTRLAALYELPDRIDSSTLATFGVCLAVAAIAATATTFKARRYPALFVTAVVYAATLAPVLGFAQSGPQLVADRYAYVATIPFGALVAGGLLAATRRRPSLFGAAAVGGLLVLAVLSWNQAGVWRDSTTLWRHAIESGHAGYVAHLDYGQALRAGGRLDDAIGQYRAALISRPNAGNAWYDLANALKAAGRMDEAERAYLQAIDHLAWKVDAQVNLGNLYYSRRQLPAAIRLYRAATNALNQVAPAERAPEPFLYLGMALSDAGETAAARDALAVAARYPATRARAEQELARMASR